MKDYAKLKKKKDYTLQYPEVNTVRELDFSQTYSYAHYLRWAFEDRMELIKGKVFHMSPAPAPVHQRVSVNLASELHQYLKGRCCAVYPAPFDVRLPGKSLLDEDIFTVVQPDISIICDENKIDGRGCIGAPEIIIEILSPGNGQRELKIKFSLYQEHGVKEYWIVYPSEHIIMKYVLDENGRFDSGTHYMGNEPLVSNLLPGFCLAMEDVFDVITV